MGQYRDISDDTNNRQSDKSANAARNALKEINDDRDKNQAAGKDSPKIGDSIKKDGRIDAGKPEDLYGDDDMPDAPGGSTPGAAAGVASAIEGMADAPGGSAAGAAAGAAGAAEGMGDALGKGRPGAGPDSGSESLDGQIAGGLGRKGEEAKLQVNPNDPFDGKGLADIIPANVDQSGLGTCFFESALASQANSEEGKKTIQNMIKSNDDGSYTVTFPGDKNHPVTVTKNDLEESAKKGQVTDQGKWARVIETAFMKYDGLAQYGEGITELQDDSGIPKFAKVNQTGRALELLTGKSASTESVSDLNIDNHELTLGSASKENVARTMQDALKRGDPITAAATDAGFLSHLGMNDSGKMVGDHVYSVLDYDPKTQEVTVRNPWNTNEGTPFEKKDDKGNTVYNTIDGITPGPNGTLKMSLDTFMKDFSDVNVAGENPDLNNANNLKDDVVRRVEAEANFAGDLVTGNWSDLGKDAADIYNKQKQIHEDVAYGVTDWGWRQFDESVTNAVKGVEVAQDVASSVADKTKDVVLDVKDKAEDLIDKWNPFS